MNTSFTKYMLDFYGHNGIYDYGFTVGQIESATQIYKACMFSKFGQTEFEGDTVDRERVRDIILDIFYPGVEVL